MGHEMLINLNHHCLPRRVLVAPVPTMKPAPTHRTAAKTGGYLMAEMMNAALMYGPGDIRAEQVPKPTHPPGRFVLRVDAVGLCGSDIRNLTTDSRKGDYPFIYGHYGATSVQVQKAFELVIRQVPRRASHQQSFATESDQRRYRIHPYRRGTEGGPRTRWKGK